MIAVFSFSVSIMKDDGVVGMTVEACETVSDICGIDALQNRTPLLP